MGRTFLMLLLSVAVVGGTVVAGDRGQVDHGRGALDRNGASILARVSDGEISRVFQDSATVFEVVESSSDGQSARLLVQRVESDSIQESWKVAFESGGEVFASHVIVSENSLSVSGSLGRTSFRYSSAYLDDVIFVSRSFGEVHVSAELYLADRSDPRNEVAAKRLRAYEQALSENPAWATVSGSMRIAMADLAERSGHSDIIGRVVQLAIGPAESSADTRSIQSYMGCLKDACRHDGGCWGGGGCHGCAGDSFFVQLAAFALYQLDAEICFVQHILSPIKW